MASELIDCRAKVTPFGDCALTAHARAHVMDKSEVVRDIVEEWARKQAQAASMLHSCMRAKGVTAADAGIAGSFGETLKWDEP